MGLQDHPGNVWAIIFPMLGFAAGIESGIWYAIIGMMISAMFICPMWLHSAYESGKLEEIKIQKLRDRREAEEKIYFNE